MEKKLNVGARTIIAEKGLLVIELLSYNLFVLRGKYFGMLFP
jgi:hypothetical protein